MKRTALFGLMALLCAVGCQREMVVPDNPTYNPETKEVTAEFVLSVSTNNANAETRMTEENTQADGSFRGIDQMHILTYTLDYTGGDNEEAFVYNPGSWPESAVATRDYDLASALTKGEISATSSSKVLEMSLPLGTNAVMIYAIASKDKTSDEQGKVELSGDPVGKSPSNIAFSLASRMSDEEAFTQFTDLMGRILTGILRSGCREETAGIGSMYDEDNRYKFWWPIDDVSRNMSLTDANGDYYANGTLDQTKQYTFHIGSQTWREYGIAYKQYLQDPSTNKMSTLEIMLGDMYNTITTIRVNPSNADEMELRAGSAQAIFRLSEDVYSMLLQVENANISTYHDYIAALVAKEIHKRAKEFFYQSQETGKLTWRPMDDDNVNPDSESIQYAVNKRIPDRTWAVNYDHITQDFFNGKFGGKEYPGFPLNMGIPAGGALMFFHTVVPAMPGAPQPVIDAATYEVVSYYKEIPAYGMGGNAVPVKNYRYPAELMYWTNSSLRTTTLTVSKDSYPTTVSAWDNDQNPKWADWVAKSKVQSTTRGVAVTKEINYGTALLKTQVKYGAETIHDNNKGIHPTEEDNAIDVKNTANQFKVTGLIIGGVDDKVGWDFLPVANSFTHLVYDNLAGQPFFIPQAGATSGAVYTMTWDNYNSSLAADKQSPVYVALELVNTTGQDLWGGLNLIRKDGTFYLVGKLDPEDTNALASLPKKNNKIDLSRDNFNYPPFDENGKTVTAPRVFMQDYVTTAIFSFNKHSLRNAYVTMPDLRASNISLGLSVDLQWVPGLYFEDVPLGGVTSDAE